MYQIVFLCLEIKFYEKNAALLVVKYYQHIECVELYRN